MRVHVVSDVHGRADALAAAGRGADLTVCLGDLILFVDYADHSRGIFADLFGAASTTKLIELRTARRFAEAREFSRGLWETVGPKGRAEAISEAVDRQYGEIFAAFPTPLLLTYGNVDVPGLYAKHQRDGIQVLDGESVQVGAHTFGFVGGGLKTPMNTPYEIDDEPYQAKVDAVGSVDIFCSHIPPHLPDLVYDVKGRRYERGSVAVLAAIRATRPAWALFGHVHTPLSSGVDLGPTRCRNVGHFNGRGTPFVLDLPDG